MVNENNLEELKENTRFKQLRRQEESFNWSLHERMIMAKFSEASGTVVLEEL